MAKTSFENLEVYQLSERLADAVWEVVKVWERLAQDTLGKQLVRSADSVGANLAEGVGRYTFRDNRRFVRYARGSLYETQHGLRRAHARGLLNEQQTQQLKPLVDELAPRLNAYHNYLSRRARQAPPRSKP